MMAKSSKWVEKTVGDVTIHIEVGNWFGAENELKKAIIARDKQLAEFLESYGPTFKHTNDPGACGTLIAEFREQEADDGQAE